MTSYFSEFAFEWTPIIPEQVQKLWSEDKVLHKNIGNIFEKYMSSSSTRFH